MHGWMDARVDGCMADRWMHACMHAWVDECMDRNRGREIDRCGLLEG